MHVSILVPFFHLFLFFRLFFSGLNSEVAWEDEGQAFRLNQNK